MMLSLVPLVARSAFVSAGEGAFSMGTARQAPRDLVDRARGDATCMPFSTVAESEGAPEAGDSVRDLRPLVELACSSLVGEDGRRGVAHRRGVDALALVMPSGGDGGEGVAEAPRDPGAHAPTAVAVAMRALAFTLFWGFSKAIRDMLPAISRSDKPRATPRFVPSAACLDARYQMPSPFSWGSGSANFERKLGSPSSASRGRAR